jgi:hypothetical protein
VRVERIEISWIPKVEEKLKRVADEDNPAPAPRVVWIDERGTT